MSEERSDLMAGATSGKRPLELAPDQATDPDDSSLAAKRIKMSDGLEDGPVDGLHDGLGNEEAAPSHNAISNGELDSPAQEPSPASNGDDKGIEDTPVEEDKCVEEDGITPAEPQPNYVAEAESEQDTVQKETNGEESSLPSVDSNSQESAPCNKPSEGNEIEGDTVDNGLTKSAEQSGNDAASDSNADQPDRHKENSTSEDLCDQDTIRTDNSGSCNGGTETEAESNAKADTLAEATPEATKAKAKEKTEAKAEEKTEAKAEAEQGEKLAGESPSETLSETDRGSGTGNAAESDGEAMDVDVENDSGSVVEDVPVKEPQSVSDTSVPKDSLDSVSKHVDSSEIEPSNMDIEEIANDKSSDPQDLSKESKESSVKSSSSESREMSSVNDKQPGDAVSSEKNTIPDSTSDSKEENDDLQENKENKSVDALHVLSAEQREARIAVMKRLNEELRNEETKLLLLKKLRLSQQQPVSVPTKPEGAAAGTATVNGAAPPTVNAQGHRTGVPMSIAHSTTTGTKPHASIQPQSNSSHRADMPQLMRGSHIQRQMHNYQKGHSGPPPLIMAQSSRSSSSSSQSGQMVRAPVVRITSSSSSSTSTSSISRQMHHSQQQHQQSHSSRQNQLANDGQSAASRQAAAKLALRKQLEKTLLQIPPPKPPPPELHFLPSAANNEFVILVGLEEVVNTILDMDKADKNQSKGFIQPYKCGQCNTDFTTIWKQVKVDPKQGIMCEACIVSNQKKALKAEHTNRLKTAFVKALQQEQEIEQRIQQSQASAPQHQQSSGRSSSGSSSSSSSNVQQRHRPPTIVHRSHGSMHHSSSSQQHKQRVMNPAPSQRVVPPIHYAYIPNLPVSAPQIQIIPKQHMIAAQRSSADRQREYLLDMIPSKGLSHAQNPVIWKR